MVAPNISDLTGGAEGLPKLTGNLPGQLIFKVDNTSDATATAEDIAKGKTAYVNGEKVTGNIVTTKEGEHVTFAAANSSVSEANNSSLFLCSGKDTNRDNLLRKGAYADVYVFRKEFGDATAEDVAAGKTFTSSAGLKVTGTHECSGGLDTSDATATAEDMAEGVTAYVNGEKVIGTVPEPEELRKYDATPEIIFFFSSDGQGRSGEYINIQSELDESDGKALVSPGTVVSQIVEKAEFGDAAAEDVAAGKTFTSSAGLKVTGTVPEPEELRKYDATPEIIFFFSSDGQGRSGEYINIQSELDESDGKALVSPGTVVSQIVEKAEFGNAAAEDVAVGKTFTSTAGLKVTGTHICAGGLDTSDATATADDMAEGVTAYVNGRKVTGTIPEETINDDATKVLDDGDGNVALQYVNKKDVILRKGKSILLHAAFTEFGDAAAEDVAAGKTFTSAAGLKVTGTHECTDGLDTSDATATAADILIEKTAYVSGQKVTGTIAAKTSSDLSSSGATVTVPAGYYAENASKSVSTVTQATPSISVDTSGKITATSEQTAGYVASGTKSATKQLTTQAAQTITPGTADKTIASGKYLTGTQTVKGDANLVAGNIKSGVSIFGVSGSYEGSGGLDTSDATAAAEDMAEGKTAYVNGEKVTGTIGNIVSIMDYPYTQNGTTHAGADVKFLDASKNAASQNLPSRIQLSCGFADLCSPSSGRYLFDKSAENTIGIAAEATKFGDATAEDVAAGKTFTSAAGLKVTGTHECGTAAGDNNCEAYQITSTSGTVSPKGSGTVKVWGYGLKSSGTYSNTIYAFVGDGYYSGSSYGTPSKTYATFGINDDGTLSGIPSGLTDLNVLITIGI